MLDRKFTVSELDTIERYLRVRIEDIAKINAESKHVAALLLELNCLDAQRATIYAEPAKPERLSHGSGVNTPMVLSPKPKAFGPGSNTGHGHVWPRPDGVTMRCGGPKLCAICAMDTAIYGVR